MEHLRQAYGTVAAQYIELFGDVAGVHPDDLSLIDRHLSIRPGTVLDVGCGPGHLTEHLRLLGVESKGIDLVPEFIEHARTTYPDGDYELGSMRDLPLADGSFRGALAWYSLIHIPPDDIDEVLAELRRVTATGGSLVTGFFDGEQVSPFEHKVATAFRWPADELSERLGRAGFEEVERLRRPGIDVAGSRPHGAIAAIAV